jgi:hypothetical protein
MQGVDTSAFLVREAALRCFRSHSHVQSSYVHEIYTDYYWSNEPSMRFDGPCEKVKIDPFMLPPYRLYCMCLYVLVCSINGCVPYAGLCTWSTGPISQ